jgi:hypothetical protein
MTFESDNVVLIVDFLAELNNELTQFKATMTTKWMAALMKCETAVAEPIIEKSKSEIERELAVAAKYLREMYEDADIAEKELISFQARLQLSETLIAITFPPNHPLSVRDICRPLRNCHYMNIMNSLMRRMNDRRLWHEKKGM